MTCKKLIPGIGCQNGQAVSLNQRQNCLENDLLALSRHYSDNGADELLIRGRAGKTSGRYQKISLCRGKGRFTQCG